MTTTTGDLGQYVANRISEILAEAEALGDPDRTWVDIAREATRNPDLERFLPVHTVRLTDGWIECTPTCDALGPHTGNNHGRREYRAEDRHGQNDTKPALAGDDRG